MFTRDLAGLTVSTVVAIISMVPTWSGRTLSDAEAARRTGGGTVNQRCCGVELTCYVSDEPVDCAAMNDSGFCVANTGVTYNPNGSGIKSCSALSAYGICVYSETFITCKSSYSCNWDPARPPGSRCYKGNDFPLSDAPESCGSTCS